MNLNQHLPLTEATYYILLSLTQPLHGYGIMQNVKSLSNERVNLAPGTLYGALDNLKKQKLIELLEDEGDSRRKVYTLTNLGRQVMELEYQRLQHLVAISAAVLEGDTNQ
ncbi:PadR family transcriptional regulator [Ornatilinea apprima]|uniref:PadR family transcriptional regulator n=1 Tax=Ornatilinea apprima TaxID=1134406 RepID=A0A0P6XXD1_9CHLR|nr:PadR family transcriptional regulator [Ornatilinea apprima]KPL80540.1 PadR family transcriptional regulator [Ornatilinea apprima]